MTSKRTKTTPEQDAEIIRRASRGESGAGIARALGVDYHAVGRRVRARRAELGDPWFGRSSSENAKRTHLNRAGKPMGVLLKELSRSDIDFLLRVAEREGCDTIAEALAELVRYAQDAEEATQ